MKVDELYAQHIKDEYGRIMKDIRGGLLGGVPVDATNEMSIVVAAYYLGWMECMLHLAQKEL